MIRPGSFAERTLAIFFLGLLLFNPPVLSLFSNDSRIGDVPLLYIYIFAAWAVLIVFMGRSARQALSGGGQAKGTGRPGVGRDRTRPDKNRPDKSRPDNTRPDNSNSDGSHSDDGTR